MSECPFCEHEPLSFQGVLRHVINTHMDQDFAYSEDGQATVHVCWCGAKLGTYMMALHLLREPIEEHYLRHVTENL